MTEKQSEQQKLVPENVEGDGKGASFEYKHYLYGLGTVIGNTLVGATAAAFGDALPVWETSLLRYATLWLTCFTVATIWRIDVRLELNKFKFLPLIAVLEILTSTSSMEALQDISTSTVTCLKQAITIVAGVTATWVVTRTYSITHLIPVGLCLVGVVLTTQPFLPSPGATHPICFPETAAAEPKWINNTGIWTPSGIELTVPTPFVDDIPTTISQNDTENQTSTSNSVLHGYIMAIMAPCLGFVSLFLYNQKLNDVNLFVILFWTSLISVAVLVVTMFILESPTFPTDSRCTALLFGHLVAFVVNVAFQCVLVQKATLVFSSVLFTFELVTILCVQYTLLKHINPGHENALEVVGAAIIVAGNAFGPFYQMYKNRTRKRE